MTNLMHAALDAVKEANERGQWYRAQTAGERVSLAYLVDHAKLCRRAWRGEAFGSRDAAFEYATPHAVKHRKVPSDGSESRSRLKHIPIVFVVLLGGCLTTSTSGDPPGGVTGVGTIHECVLRYECSKATETVRVCVPALGEGEVVDLCPSGDAQPKPSCACSFVCEETLKPCTIGGAQ